MRRVVVTGLGIVSSIGNNAEEVLASLKGGKSGITANEEMAEHGFRSRIAGDLKIDVSEHVDKRTQRFMGPGAAYAHIAMQQAIADAGLEEGDIVNPRTGLVAGSGGPSTSAMLSAHQTVLKTGGTKRIGPFAVPKCMCSTVSANLSTAFKIKGINYSITSACSTSLHCIGNAAEQIMMGKQDVMFAGGGEELDWTLSCLFDAMGAMSSKRNDTPEAASRAFDADRDGFVISGGGGMLVLEDLEHAKARGAKIYAEVSGYGLTGDAYHITAPAEGAEGGYRAMKMALKNSGIDPTEVDYINAHGTSTPKGDEGEAGAVERAYGDHAANMSMSSTKSAVGHLLGAAGAIESAFCALAIRDQIMPPTLNLDNPSFETKLDLIPHKAKEGRVRAAMSNSFGFGGTNASLVLREVK
ncbi:beta-ketoacyl-ACP synthase II [Hyphomonas sp.]|uniref:beta-ketoacyl-[acyl-carrier-protein] synthase family protein n=1 Tax=Hyphomonas sp. TaxID=87 RepID=UPI0032EF4D1A